MALRRMVEAMVALSLVLVCLVLAAPCSGDSRGATPTRKPAATAHRKAKAPPRETPTVCVATVRQDWAALKRVTEALSRAGTPGFRVCDLGVCGVHVEPQNRDRAVAALEKDAKEEGYWVRLYPRDRDPYELGPDQKALDKMVRVARVRGSRASRLAQRAVEKAAESVFAPGASAFPENRDGTCDIEVELRNRAVVLQALLRDAKRHGYRVQVFPAPKRQSPSHEPGP